MQPFRSLLLWGILNRCYFKGKILNEQTSWSWICKLYIHHTSFDMQNCLWCWSKWHVFLLLFSHKTSSTFMWRRHADHFLNQKLIETSRVSIQAFFKKCSPFISSTVPQHLNLRIKFRNKLFFMYHSYTAISVHLTFCTNMCWWWLL